MLLNIAKSTLFFFICIIFVIIQNNIAFAENKSNLSIVKAIEEISEAIKNSKGRVICVYGNDQIAELLISRNTSAINFNNRTSFEKSSQCKLLYFGLDRTRTIRNDLDNFINHQVITVSMIEDFTSIGGIVGFQSGRKKIEAVINLRLLVKKNIQLNPLLFEYVDNN